MLPLLVLARPQAPSRARSRRRTHTGKMASSTARASAYLYTTDDDVIALRDALVECREWFGAA